LRMARNQGCPLSAAKKGAFGEMKAAEYLRGKGYALVARNFRSRTGEIDIIAEKDGVLAFVEVKAWEAFGEADLEYSIGRTKPRGFLLPAGRSSPACGHVLTSFFAGEGAPMPESATSRMHSAERSSSGKDSEENGSEENRGAQEKDP
jgi:hypothetical protein